MQDHVKKINTLNRCFFDAEHGWLTLAFQRLVDICNEFPCDPQIEYAEALILKDFLGEGLKAQDLFLSANQHATTRVKSNENFLFSTFNSVLYARNEPEFRERLKMAQELAPSDPDMKFFYGILDDLDKGVSYGEILSQAIGDYQKAGKHGECASFAEIALNCQAWGLDNELELRKARMSSLRELDKIAQASREARGEGYPPGERLILLAALNELDVALKLDPEDHILWNFRSVWLHLLDLQEESIEAADTALSLCPDGYVKPLTNKALALQKLNRPDEAREFVTKALESSRLLGDYGKGDMQIAKSILEGLNQQPVADDLILKELAMQIIGSAQATSQKEVSQWKGSSEGRLLKKALKRRVSKLGKEWSNDYINLMKELVFDFTPESAFFSVMSLTDNRQDAYQHCLYAFIYIAAHEKGIMQRDVCRLLILTILGAMEPELIRKAYREAILGPTEAGPNEFKLLEKNMRSEISKFSPILLKLVADQDPLSTGEIEYAKQITLSRFV